MQYFVDVTIVLSAIGFAYLSCVVGDRRDAVRERRRRCTQH